VSGWAGGSKARGAYHGFEGREKVVRWMGRETKDGLVSVEREHGPAGGLCRRSEEDGWSG
jgi:hypothetical protein